MNCLPRLLLIATAFTLINDCEASVSFLSAKRRGVSAVTDKRARPKAQASKRSRLLSDATQSDSEVAPLSKRSRRSHSEELTHPNLSHDEMSDSDDFAMLSPRGYSSDHTQDQDFMSDGDDLTESTRLDWSYTPKETGLSSPETDSSASTSPFFDSLDSPATPDFSYITDSTSQPQIFDLPTNILGTQKEVKKSINGISATYIQVSIPATKNANIFFPTDGHQPTTPEAVEYSCAKVDNVENSPITDWYIRMFGILPYEGKKRVRAGYEKKESGSDDIRPKEIIEFQKICACQLHKLSKKILEQEGFNKVYEAKKKKQTSTTPGGMVAISPECGAIDTQHMCIDTFNGGQVSNRLDFCKKMFRKIASTPVGRVLLYRILIEIRRHRKGSNHGCLDSNVASELRENAPDPKEVAELMKQRDDSRYLVVAWDPDGEFIPGNACICTSDEESMGTAIGTESSRGYTHIPHCAIPPDVSLFHELVHWFLFLRDPVRVDKEASDEDLANWPLPYWNDPTLETTTEREKVTRSKWNTHDKEGNAHFSFEEIRTILGVPSNFPLYHNGDDISENLYRTCVGLPLRYGHDDEEFYEDNRIIDRILQTTCNNSRPYHDSSWSIENMPVSTKKVGFAYNNPKNLNGLGMGKVKSLPKKARAKVDTFPDIKSELTPSQRPIPHKMDAAKDSPDLRKDLDKQTEQMWEDVFSAPPELVGLDLR